MKDPVVCDLVPTDRVAERYINRLFLTEKSNDAYDNLKKLCPYRLVWNLDGVLRPVDFIGKFYFMIVIGWTEKNTFHQEAFHELGLSERADLTYLLLRYPTLKFSDKTIVLDRFHMNMPWVTDPNI